MQCHSRSITEMGSILSQMPLLRHLSAAAISTYLYSFTLSHRGRGRGFGLRAVSAGGAWFSFDPFQWYFTKKGPRRALAGLCGREIKARQLPNYDADWHARRGWVYKQHLHRIVEGPELWFWNPLAAYWQVAKRLGIVCPRCRLLARPSAGRDGLPNRKIGAPGANCASSLLHAKIEEHVTAHAGRNFVGERGRVDWWPLCEPCTPCAVEVAGDFKNSLSHDRIAGAKLLLRWGVSGLLEAA